MELPLLISADSHVLEPPALWAERLPPSLREAAPKFPPHKLGAGFMHHAGGHDPDARLKEMAADGVGAEVLYPTLALSLFGLDDVKLQQACFRVYNDWMIEFCSVAPERLVGVAAISAWDPAAAVAEIARCRKAGLRGIMVWQCPHESLPFSSRHYDPIWAAAQDHGMPVSLHILTGHGNSKSAIAAIGSANNLERYRLAVNLKLLDVSNAVFDFIFYGALDRHPRMKLVTVENEVGWMPFLFQHWDYYCDKFREQNPAPIRRQPSGYLSGQVYGTFFNDRLAGQALVHDYADAWMWSNDFPHPNSPWPESRKVIADHLGHLPAATLDKVLAGNAAALYGLDRTRIAAG